MHATRWESPEITRKEIAFSFERGGKWLIVSFFPFSLGNERALSWERISRFLFILLSIAWRISTPSGCTSVLSLVNEAKWNAEMGVYGWRAIRRAFNCNLADEIKLKLPGKCIPVCIRHRAIYIYIYIYIYMYIYMYIPTSVYELSNNVAGGTLDVNYFWSRYWTTICVKSIRSVTTFNL